MNSPAGGFLVVLSDVKSENDRDYLGWLTTEHVQERLGIDGFLAVRIFRRPIADGYRYFIWYRLANADVVDSAAYLERLNNPTSWSRRIMPILENFGRGGGAVVASAGVETGAFLLVVGFNEIPPEADRLVLDAKAEPKVSAAHLLVTDSKKSEIRTNERDLRTSHSSFAALLVVESQSEKALHALSPKTASSGMEAIGGLYREVFALANEMR